ncbi:juvenile hormone acid O-methyltransferase-like [Onthophagus taurus]|uniref:juvenile hormone acid O-methyltransferase-like n=1 Tax=Onthophagus taurus TaxID=166361 RepID=UPI0039BE61FD
MEKVLFSSKLYADNNLSAVDHARSFLENYKDFFHWANSEDILEVGCSNGRITKEILYPFVKKHLNCLIGADICPEAIQIANETNNLMNLSFETMDITDLDLCYKYKERFNHIFALYLFHVVERSDLWSTNVFQMLKPNGQLFFSVIANEDNFANKCLSAQQSDNTKPWYKYIKDLRLYFVDYGPTPKETITNILEGAGFIIDKIDLYHDALLHYPNTDVMRSTFLSTNPFYSHIPDELKAPYFEDYVNKLLDYVTYENGMYTIKFDVLTVLATKYDSKHI